MNTYLALRFVKFIGTAVLFKGITATFSATAPQDRAKQAAFHAAPGFVITWLTGLALVSKTNVPLLSTWVIGAVLLSLVALWATLAQAFLVNDKKPALAMVASLGFVGALALMVWKP